LLQLGKNFFLEDFEVIFSIFCKSAVLNIRLYLKHYYTYEKINNFFKVLSSFILKDGKIMEIGYKSFLLESASQKLYQHANE